MMLIVGWPSATRYAQAMPYRLAHIAAALCEEQLITGCLAALPADSTGRLWLFSFLDSLRSAGIDRLGVLLSTSGLTCSDLEECEASGLNEVVLVQDDCSPTSAIEVVCQYQSATPHSRIGFRIWFDYTPPGGYQRNVSAWRRAVPSVLSLELAPFDRQPPAANAGALTEGHAESLRCDWLRTMITVLDSSAVVPCPAHQPQHAVVFNELTSSELLSQIESWSGSLGSHAVCRSCHRLARFSIPEWLHVPDRQGQIMASSGLTRPYHDHITCDAGTVSSEDRELLIAEFITRVRKSRMPSECAE